MTDDSKLIEKIKAILRKADESANSSDEERDTAMRMANRLLLKHGLSMADVELDADDAGPSWMHEFSGVQTDADREYWKGVLLHRIARVYFCKAYYTTWSRNQKRWMIVGKDANVATTMAMYEFIVPQLQAEHDLALAKITRTSSPHQQQQARHARRYAMHALHIENPSIDPRELSDDELAEVGKVRFAELADESADMALLDIMHVCNVSMNFAKKVRAFVKRGDIAGAGVENLAVWRRSFFDAAVDRVASRLTALMRSDVNDLGDAGSALVKDERSDLDAFLASLDLGLTSRQSNRSVDAHGAGAGRAAGDRADVSGHRKVGGLGPRQLNA